MSAILPFANPKREALDEACRIAAALNGVSDLMVPGGDIQDLQKDHIAILLDVLLERLEAALETAYPGV